MSAVVTEELRTLRERGVRWLTLAGWAASFAFLLVALWSGDYAWQALLAPSGIDLDALKHAPQGRVTRPLATRYRKYAGTAGAAATGVLRVSRWAGVCAPLVSIAAVRRAGATRRGGGAAKPWTFLVWIKSSVCHSSWMVA